MTILYTFLKRKMEGETESCHIYLIIILFQKIEAWESEKSEADMEYYDWDASASRKNVTGLLSWKPDQSEAQISADAIQLDLKEYKEAVSKIMNEGKVEIPLHMTTSYV
jgi:small subunit ribosomal protein S35